MSGLPEQGVEGKATGENAISEQLAEAMLYLNLSARSRVMERLELKPVTRQKMAKVEVACFELETTEDQKGSVAPHGLYVHAPRGLLSGNVEAAGFDISSHSDFLLVPMSFSWWPFGGTLNPKKRRHQNIPAGKGALELLVTPPGALKVTPDVLSVNRKFVKNDYFVLDLTVSHNDHGVIQFNGYNTFLPLRDSGKIELTKEVVFEAGRVTVREVLAAAVCQGRWIVTLQNVRKDVLEGLLGITGDETVVQEALALYAEQHNFDNSQWNLGELIWRYTIEQFGPPG